MDHLVSNIRYLRNQKGMTQEEFATELGIKRSLLGAYEEGRARPNIQTQLNITKIFGISLDELIKTDLSKANTDQPAAAGVPAVAENVEEMQSGDLRILSITVDQEQRENIELVTQKAVAGYLNGYADPEFVRDLPKFRLPFLPSGTFRAFEISGDSMLPVQSGSLLIGEYVSSWDDVRDGVTYILLTKEDGIVYKRLFQQLKHNGTVVLQSDNPSYPPYTVKADDVIEIWEAKLNISKIAPQQDYTVDKMMQMIMKLQNEVDQLKKN